MPALGQSTDRRKQPIDSNIAVQLIVGSERKIGERRHSPAVERKELVRCLQRHVGGVRRPAMRGRYPQLITKNEIPQYASCSVPTKSDLKLLCVVKNSIRAKSFHTQVPSPAAATSLTSGAKRCRPCILLGRPMTQPKAADHCPRARRRRLPREGRPCMASGPAVAFAAYR